MWPGAATTIPSLIHLIVKAKNTLMVLNRPIQEVVAMDGKLMVKAMAGNQMALLLPFHDSVSLHQLNGKSKTSLR